MPTKYKRHCDFCGEYYEGYGERFCSRKCVRDNQKSKRPEFKCKYCGKSFRVSPSTVKHRKPKYCSHDCWYSHCKESDITKNRIIKICESCGKEFEVVASRKDARFCSNDCMIKWRTREMKQRHDPSKYRVKRQCKWCGKEFTAYKCWVEKGEGLFCSRNCVGAWTIRNSQSRVSEIEKKMIAKLKRSGLKFETQYQFKHFILDIAFPEQKLAVEVDGVYWHSLPNVIEKDKRKDRLLQNSGWDVIHITGDEVRSDINKAASKIVEKIS